jgi:Uma2 family endonuclease
MATAAAVRVTPEELARMPDGDRYELVHGTLVEMPVSFLSSYVAGEIYFRLRSHSSQGKRTTWVLPEGTAFRCFPHEPGMVRKPDTSAIRLDRVTTDQAVTEGYFPVAPDLAVEVLSPNDIALEVEEKIDDYRRAGVRLVWVINPQHHTVRIHRLDGTIQQLGEADELTGEDVIPGFRCPVRELFLGPGGNLLQPPPVEIRE